MENLYLEITKINKYIKKLINLRNEVGEVQLSIDASHQMMEENL